ncbi:outer membrane protein assembly factor BamA [Thermithiobacillus tepidarius DSM 3134]|uniref:outer membrane protein assembly factor BamA n=1 Tax=Thermithiobacillus tepidarius TaxID=929 RepID=UPI000400BECC|nr:outer membrane protein assembly factor BamA [Thermithiobacillus tepidarius]
MIKRTTSSSRRKHALRAAILAAALGLPALSAWAFEPFTVSDIQIRGLEQTDPGTVYNYLPIKTGTLLTEEGARAAIKALYDTGFFEDVQLGREGDRLVVTVRERPTIAEISLNGVKAFPQDKLKESLKDIGLVERRVFDPATLDQIVTELERQYYGMGYYAAKIKVEVERLERNRVRIRIDVDEGQPAKIQQVNVVGNRAFPRQTLIGLFSLGKTGAFSTFTKNDQYSRQKLLGDLEKLRSYYMDRGYLDFDIESTQVTVTPDRRHVFITVNVKEGARYRVKSVSLSGQTDVPATELRKLITVQPGALFSRREVTESANAIADRLGDVGYAFANVNPVPAVDKDKHEVSFDFQVSQGRRVYVRRINVSGNNRTRDYVIRREFRQMEGAWYDASKIRRSKERVNRLGYFDEVNLETPAVPDASDQVDINVNVTERSTGQFMLGVGYSNAQGVLFNGSVTQRNFMGKGQILSASVDVSDLVKSFNLSFTEPYFTPDGISLGGDIYRTDTNTQRLIIAQYRQVTSGAAVRVGLPITEHVNDIVRLGYENTSLSLVEESPQRYKDFVATFGDNVSSVKASNTLVYDSRDSIIYPTKGWNNRLITEGTLPGGDLRYYRVELQGQYYRPITRSLTGFINAEYGFVNGYSGKGVPFFQNFYLGGPNSVRGYRTFSLGPLDPVDNVSLGGTRKVQLNTELLFPVPGMADSKSFRGSIFFDAGWVYDDKYLPSFSELRKSTGIGFHWISPLGPLRFSLAYPIGVKPGDRKEPFQFTIGTNF